MDTATVISIKSDDVVVAYACTEPYEVGCVSRGEDRFTAILSDTPIAIQLPRHAEVNTPQYDDGTVVLPNPPTVKPTSGRNRIEDFLIEIDATTGFELAEPHMPVHTLREKTDASPLEVETDIPTERELYETIADTINSVRENTSPAPEPQKIQQIFQSYLTQMSVSAAIDKIESKPSGSE